MVQGFIQNARRVLTQPNVASFDAAIPSANWNSVLLAVGALAVVRGITAAIASYYVSSVLPGLGRFGAYYTPNPIGSFFGGVIITFIGFFIGVGILYLVARMFGGQGPFMVYSHALALAYIPLGIAAAIVGLIPFLGTLAALAAGIYAIYLAIQATASTHRLSQGKSVAVVLIPVAVIFVLALCAATLLAATLIGLTHISTS